MRIVRLAALLSAFLAVSFVSLVTSPASAATLDPGLKWHSAETEHFVVYWYEGEELAAKRVLELAEPVFQDVTKALDWKPKPKTHIVLTDVTDSANGFAISVPFNTIRLFVTAPQEGSSLDNYDDWLRLLFTHEFTHITHIDKVGGVPWVMRGVFGSIIDPNQIQPRWIVEGLATYEETQLSTAGRGRSTFADMLVRAAVLEHDFPKISRAGGETEEWPSGYIPYIFGVEFWGYLRDHYGDEKVTEFTRRTGREPFPFFPFFPRINHHAKKCFGKSFYRLWKDWQSELAVTYGDQKTKLEAEGLTPIERLTKHGGTTQAPRLSPDGKRIVYSMANGKGPSSIRLMDLDGTHDKALLVKYTADGFAWSPDGKVIAFGAEKVWKDYYVWSDVYTVTVDDKRLTRVTRGARARNPDFRPDGAELLFVTNDTGNNDFVSTKIDQSLAWKTNNTDWTQYSTPRFRPDGELFAASLWQQGGFRDIALFDAKGRLYQRITADRSLDRDPTWTADGKFMLFSSDRTGIANLYAWEQETGSFFQVTNVLNGAFQPSVTPDSKWIVFQGYSADGYDVYRTAFDRTKWRELGWSYDPEVYDATCMPPKPTASLPTTVPLEAVSPTDTDSDSGTATGTGAGTIASFGIGRAFGEEPQPDVRDSQDKISGGGRRPEDAPNKNKDVDLSAWNPRKGYNPWRTLAPRYWLPAQVWFTESGATFGAFTGGTDPLFRHSYSAWLNYNTSAAFVGGGVRYFNDRWKPTLYLGGDRYVLDYGQSIYEYPEIREPGSHLLNIHPTGEHYFEAHNSAQIGAFYWWRARYFLSLRYLIDDRSAWTDVDAFTYQPFLPVRGTFAGPSLAVTLDRTEQYRWSISPQKGYRVTATFEAQERIFGSDFRKEIGTVDARAYWSVPLIRYSVFGVRAVGGYAQGDDIRPSTFRLGGALGESVFSVSTPNYYSLRGYPFFAFGGERLLLGSAEYRFPIWRANRGIGTGPIFLRTVHGALFADSGQAWRATDDPSADNFHTGAGGEVRLDTVWFYYFPLTIRLGYAVALNEDPAGYAPGDPYGAILTLGTSF